MEIKNVIKIHMERLNTLEKEDHNQYLFYFGVFCLFYSFYVAYKYSWGFIMLGFIVYAICAYKSVKW